MERADLAKPCVMPKPRPLGDSRDVSIQKPDVASAIPDDREPLVERVRRPRRDYRSYKTVIDGGIVTPIDLTARKQSLVRLEFHGSCSERECA
jgi:hypothetical protein